MNTLLPGKSVIAFCVMAFSPMTLAHAQEAARPLTLADCPPGYTLGVQSTTEPQPLAHPYDPNAVAGNPSDQDAKALAAQQAAAPRLFVTGCIPPHSQQQAIQPTEDFYGNVNDAQ